MTDEAAARASTTTPEGFYDALAEDDPEELYETAPCGYLSCAPDGTIVKANRTFLSWTGHDPGELVGRKRFQEILPAGDRIFYETHFAPLLRMQGTVREIAVEIVCASGERLPALVNAALKRDDHGEPLVVRIAVFDARERRAYERELLGARREAEVSGERARALAEALQQTFLPPLAVSIAGLDVAGAFRPAGRGSEVGGDFYDVFALGGGRSGVVLGDVCGKGVEAAAVTALARYAVRMEATHSEAPSDVLRAVHEAVLGDAVMRGTPRRFCTAVYATVEPVGDGFLLTVSAGGHHLPALVSSTGAVASVGAPGTMLGMFDHPNLVDVAVDLDPGDTVVLFTDGVLEARRGDEFFGEERLLSLISDMAGSGARDVADAVVRAAVDFQVGDTRDDIAVVVLRVPPSVV